MPRGKSLELVERDGQILQMYAEGYTQRKIASTLGISAARVNQILKEYGMTVSQGFEEDADRSLAGEKLDVLIERTMSYALGPGDQKVSSVGELVYEPLLDEDGEFIRDKRGKPVPDPSRPVYDRFNIVKAAEVAGRLISQRSKLFATERRQQVAGDAAIHDEVLQYIATLEETVRKQNALLPGGEILEGEVVESEGDPA